MTKKISIHKKTIQEIEESGINRWPVWTCEVSAFPWEYVEKESCYLLEGLVEVTTDEETVRFGAGDFVVFPEDLTCRWNVLSPVKKYYQFG